MTENTEPPNPVHGHLASNRVLPGSMYFPILTSLGFHGDPLSLAGTVKPPFRGRQTAGQEQWSLESEHHFISTPQLLLLNRDQQQKLLALSFESLHKPQPSELLAGAILPSWGFSYRARQRIRKSILATREREVWVCGMCTVTGIAVEQPGGDHVVE